MAARHAPLLPRCRMRGCVIEASVEHQLEQLGDLLIEAEGALTFERNRRRRTEFELGVMERALLRLLQRSGSDVADRRELRLRLGLPA